jgi:hypothetical protein
VALNILVPDLRRLSWDDLAEVRASRDLRSLRSVLAELESSAWDAYESGQDLNQAVHVEYSALLERGARYSLSFSGTIRAAAAAAAVSLVTGAIPAVPAAALAAAGVLVGQAYRAARFETSWLSALLDVRKRSLAPTPNTK